MPDKAFPVVEVFGPVVQGEGPDVGVPCHFVRMGGCDYRCSWCDSPFAVDPKLVRQAERLTAKQVVARVSKLGHPQRVVLSGGNPALHDLGDLVDQLRFRAYHVAVETQGSRWAEWLRRVSRLVVSPKPPSSGMAERTDRQLDAFMKQTAGTQLALKIVVFDEADYEWAVEALGRYPDAPGFLSAGTDQDARSLSDVRANVGNRYAWLCDRAAGDPRVGRVRLLPQAHVVAYGHERGR